MRTRRNFLKTAGKASLATILGLTGCASQDEDFSHHRKIKAHQEHPTETYFKAYEDFMSQEVKFTEQETNYLKIVHERWGEQITIGEYMEKPMVPWMRKFKAEKGKDYILTDKEIVFLSRNSPVYSY